MTEIQFIPQIDTKEFQLPTDSNPNKKAEGVIDRAPRVIYHLECMRDKFQTEFEQYDAVLTIEYKDEKVVVAQAKKVQNKEWQDRKEKVKRIERGIKLWYCEWVSARKMLSQFT